MATRHRAPVRSVAGGRRFPMAGRRIPSSHRPLGHRIPAATGLGPLYREPTQAKTAMATTPKLTGTIDIALHAIGAEADFLPELAAMWDEESPANRADWDIEWTD